MNYRSLRRHRRHRPPAPPVIPAENPPTDYPFFPEFTQRVKDEQARIRAERILADLAAQSERAASELAAAEQALVAEAAAVDRRITRAVRTAAATAWVLCLFGALAALAGCP